MSTTYKIVAPTDAEIQQNMADTGADITNATRTLQLKAAMDAIDTIVDVDDVKKFLRVVVRRLVPLL